MPSYLQFWLEVLTVEVAHFFTRKIKLAENNQDKPVGDKDHNPVPNIQRVPPVFIQKSKDSVPLTSPLSKSENDEEPKTGEPKTGSGLDIRHE